VSEVRKNTTAITVDARVKNVAAPLPPKSVWLEPAPNAPASPPPFPDWSRIDTMSATHAKTWMAEMTAVMKPDICFPPTKSL